MRVELSASRFIPNTSPEEQLCLAGHVLNAVKTTRCDASRLTTSAHPHRQLARAAISFIPGWMGKWRVSSVDSVSLFAAPEVWIECPASSGEAAEEQVRAKLHGLDGRQ
jgi:hypothetical protein